MINEQQAHLYCKDDIAKIENYGRALNDTTQTWDLHHRTEIWWNCTAKELVENECYFNRKACELIFLTKAEHTKLHMKGKTFTTEHRQKISEALKVKHADVNGTNNPMYGRKGSSNPNYGSHRTEETRKKMSDAIKAYWARRKQGGNYDAKMG